MLKIKINYFLIALFLMNGLIYTQMSKDYSKSFNDLLQNSKSEEEFSEKSKTLFLTIKNSEFSLALANMAKGYSAEFIVHNIIEPNKKRLENKIVINNIISELNFKDNSKEFKIVTIDYISNIIQNNFELIIQANEQLFELTENDSLDKDLRSYAIAHIALTKIDVENKKINDKLMVLAENFMLNNEYSLLNGAIRSIEKILKAKTTPESTKEQWYNMLSSFVKSNSNELDKANGIIFVLGNSGSTVIRKELLNQLAVETTTKKEFCEILALALSNKMNKNELNTVFNKFYSNNLFNSFSSELTLKQIVAKNMNLIDELKNDKSTESTITFLHTIKYLPSPQRKNFLEEIKGSLGNSDAIVRLEAIKALRFTLTYEEEVELFTKHLKGENNSEIINKIHFYIGS